MEGKIRALRDLYVRYIRRIMRREISVEKLAKRETLKDIGEYEEKVDDPDHGRSRDARYEIAKRFEGISTAYGTEVRYYNAGSSASDRMYEVAKPISEYDEDENREYYVKKRMRRFVSKFKPFFRDADYERLFPDTPPPALFDDDLSDVLPVRRQIRDPENFNDSFTLIPEHKRVG
jgi:hypothetical protein